jgi:hypothetical protein
MSGESTVSKSFGIGSDLRLEQFGKCFRGSLEAMRRRCEMLLEVQGADLCRSASGFRPRRIVASTPCQPHF